MYREAGDFFSNLKIFLLVESWANLPRQRYKLLHVLIPIIRAKDELRGFKTLH